MNTLLVENSLDGYAYFAFPVACIALKQRMLSKSYAPLAHGRHEGILPEKLGELGAKVPFTCVTPPRDP